jgi:aspartate aminotransferase
VADLMIASGAMPMIDIAYQGFGDGLEEDAAGTRLLVTRGCPRS